MSVSSGFTEVKVRLPIVEGFTYTNEYRAPMPMEWYLVFISEIGKFVTSRNTWDVPLQRPYFILKSKKDPPVQIIKYPEPTTVALHISSPAPEPAPVPLPKKEIVVVPVLKKKRGRPKKA